MANISVASLTQKSLFLVCLMCWTTSSTGVAFSFEEEFLHLKENYIQMKEIVKSLESKVTELEAKVQQQDSLLIPLLREKNERTKAFDSDSAPIITSQSVAINGLPSSCDDLKMIGHTLNGFYSIMGLVMMESVFCDFTKPSSDAGFQKWIGYVDVKSAPVHFYVQRSSDFGTKTIPIPFDLARVNEGNAMDLTTGKFTAPRTGIYFFSFAGLASFPTTSSLIIDLNIKLYCNAIEIAGSAVEEANTLSGQNSPLTLQSTLNLKKGDQVWVAISSMASGVSLFDNSGHFTHFTGFMLEEEISASL